MKQFLLVVILLNFMCKAQGQFSQVLTGPHVTDSKSSYGAAWIDFDADGYEDLFVTTSLEGSTEDLLYRNNGDGTFTAIAGVAPVTETGTGRNATWADYDNNGFPDVFVVNQITTSLFQNLGDTQFNKEEGLPSLSQSFDSDHSGAAWGDFDGDGDLDLFLSNYAISDVSQNYLYENTPSGFIVNNNPTISERSSAQDPSWIDYDNNGTLDLFVPNYMADQLFVYRNNGDKTFTKIMAGMPLQFASPCTGMAWGDYDNDGDFDVVFSINVNSDNWFYENNGDGTFSFKVNAITSVKSSTLSWGDFDNDGNIDLLCAGGDGDKIYLFKNNGDKTFTDVTVQYGLNNTNYTWAAATADYDKDGFLDIFLANASGNLHSTDDILYHNNGNINHWLSIELAGTSSNRSAIGANVTVFINGQKQMRTIQSKTGPNSQNSLRAHFGLGSNEMADSIVIEWPLKGFQYLTNVTADQFITIEESALPDRPLNLVGENNGFKKVTLNWTDNSSEETGFRIERSKGDANNFELIAEVGANTASYADEEADSPGTFYYRVYAKGQNGLSLASATVKIESVITGVNQESRTFSVYPNPIKDFINIVGHRTPNEQFEIKTLLGEPVKKFRLNGVDGNFYVADLSAGMYILTNNKQSVKIIKIE